MLAIHDISRTESDGTSPLPRFNMPLELGIFLGAKSIGPAQQRRKRALILDVEQYRYQRFISDIAGQDIRAHAGDPLAAMKRVRDFLGNQRPEETGWLPGARRILKRFRAYQTDLPAVMKSIRLEPDELSFTDQLTTMEAWIASNPL